MFLAVHPDDSGFTIAMGFRTANLAQVEMDAVREDADALGLKLGEASMVPIWSMALPDTG